MIDDDSNDDDEGEAGRARSTMLGATARKKKKGEFSPELLALLEELKVERSKRMFLFNLVIVTWLRRYLSRAHN